MLALRRCAIDASAIQRGTGMTYWSSNILSSTSSVPFSSLLHAHAEIGRYIERWCTDVYLLLAIAGASTCTHLCARIRVGIHARAEARAQPTNARACLHAIARACARVRAHMRAHMRHARAHACTHAPCACARMHVCPRTVQCTRVHGHT